MNYSYDTIGVTILNVGVSGISQEYTVTVKVVLETLFNPIQTGLFWTIWDLGGGGGGLSLPKYLSNRNETYRIYMMFEHLSFGIRHVE